MGQTFRNILALGEALSRSPAQKMTIYSMNDTIYRKVPPVVVSVNFRLAPEHRYPSQHDDGFNVLKFLNYEENRTKSLPENANMLGCFLVGDSVGGNLAHHVAQKVCEYNFRTTQGQQSCSEERTDLESRLAGTPIVSIDSLQFRIAIGTSAGTRRLSDDMKETDDILMEKLNVIDRKLEEKLAQLDHTFGRKGKVLEEEIRDFAEEINSLIEKKRRPLFRKGFDVKLIDVNRTCKVTKGGQLIKYTVMLACGNYHGVIDFAKGKGPAVPIACQKKLKEIIEFGSELGTRVDFILLMEPMKNSWEGLNGRQIYYWLIFKGINKFNMCRNHWRPLLVNEIVGRDDCSVEGEDKVDEISLTSVDVYSTKGKPLLFNGALFSGVKDNYFAVVKFTDKGKEEDVLLANNDVLRGIARRLLATVFDLRLFGFSPLHSYNCSLSLIHDRHQRLNLDEKLDSRICCCWMGLVGVLDVVAKMKKARGANEKDVWCIYEIVTTCFEDYIIWEGHNILLSS
ncbi:hypothetical protein L2E82_14657 [Cichorium intybus]|uniref:Uncharacterized protein n=1 Tax=Cichorium intybus TaxID=13427 RepID=A0ACB9F107_CICIN|nr:hypothetical protein L2E82_14657 [Cichorium intybus]